MIFLTLLVFLSCKPCLGHADQWKSSFVTNRIKVYNLEIGYVIIKFRFFVCIYKNPVVQRSIFVPNKK